MTRKELLEEAARITATDRQSQYGTPENSFETIAQFWSTYLKARPAGAGEPIAAHDVAAMMALLKVARIAKSPQKEDSWVDGAGYMACGAEIATASENTAGGL